jgi:hypothetical protein
MCNACIYVRNDTIALIEDIFSLGVLSIAAQVQKPVFGTVHTVELAVQNVSEKRETETCTAVQIIKMTH